MEAIRQLHVLFQEPTMQFFVLPGNWTMNCVHQLFLVREMLPCVVSQEVEQSADVLPAFALFRGFQQFVQFVEQSLMLQVNLLNACCHRLGVPDNTLGSGRG